VLLNIIADETSNSCLGQRHQQAVKIQIYLKTEHFTVVVKENDTTKTANIKIVVLQSWHISTRTRTIAMF